ncbi:NOL1/NOP2/Sun domain family member 6 [Pelomyxa schiedti]|nr:NOL1/NOP2/Sun domain family member 6 [Pelomyxa schiedti]
MASVSRYVNQENEATSCWLRPEVVEFLSREDIYGPRVSQLRRVIATPPPLTTLRANLAPGRTPVRGDVGGPNTRASPAADADAATAITTRAQVAQHLRDKLGASFDVACDDRLPDLIVVRSSASSRGRGGGAAADSHSSEPPAPAPAESASAPPSATTTATASTVTKGEEKGFPEVIVDAKCGEAVMRGAEVFAPGVVGAETGINTGHTVAVYADADGTCKKGETNKFLGRKVFVGNGVAMMGRSFFYKVKTGVAVQMTERVYHMPPLNGFLEDVLFLQNLPSMLVAPILSPTPGSLILDMCAAPGGKTSHIASIMENKGRVIAIDKTPQKVVQLKATCSRLGATCVECYSFDSTKLLSEPPSHSTSNSTPAAATTASTNPSTATSSAAMHVTIDNIGVPPYPPNTFDAILLDPPCSGIGLRPCLREPMHLKDLEGHCRYQRKLIHVAVALLKPGGTLVYSTCTVNPQEGEQNVHFILTTFPNMQLVAPPQFVHEFGGIGRNGTGLTADQARMVVRFDPCVQTDHPAFFAAKFKKNSV